MLVSLDPIKIVIATIRNSQSFRNSEMIITASVNNMYIQGIMGRSDKQQPLGGFVLNTDQLGRLIELPIGTNRDRTHTKLLAQFRHAVVKTDGFTAS